MHNSLVLPSRTFEMLHNFSHTIETSAWPELAVIVSMTPLLCVAPPLPGVAVPSPEITQLRNTGKDENCGCTPTRVLKFVVEVTILVFDVNLLKN